MRPTREEDIPLRNRAKEMVVRLGSEATNHWMQF